MIRPLTIATCLLACASGLYLYQEKHEVQVLDRTIERTVHETGALREQSRLLAAEWTMLNDPERLRQFSDTYLSLKTISPMQFTSLGDLNGRLPAARAEPPPREEQPLVAMAEGSPLLGAADADADSDPAAVAEKLPVPPIPAAPPPAASVVAVARVPDRVPPVRPMGTDGASRIAMAGPMRASEPHAMEQHPADQRPGDAFSADQRATARPSDGHSEVRTAMVPAPIVLNPRRAAYPSQGPVQGPGSFDPSRSGMSAAPRPVMAAAPRPVTEPTPHPVMAAVSRPPMEASPRPAYLAPPPQPAPYGGSLLGMARGSMPAAPRPTPVSATYNAN